jgi:hypothetical protein
MQHTSADDWRLFIRFNLQFRMNQASSRVLPEEKVWHEYYFMRWLESKQLTGNLPSVHHFVRLKTVLDVLTAPPTPS